MLLAEGTTYKASPSYARIGQNLNCARAGLALVSRPSHMKVWLARLGRSWLVGPYMESSCQITKVY